MRSATATNGRPPGMRETAAMKTLAFETTIDAVVRVQAADEGSARKAVPTVLAAPGIADIKIANENVIAGLGIDAVIDDVNFELRIRLGPTRSQWRARQAPPGVTVVPEHFRERLGSRLARRGCRPGHCGCPKPKERPSGRSRGALKIRRQMEIPPEGIRRRCWLVLLGRGITPLRLLICSAAFVGLRLPALRRCPLHQSRAVPE